MEKDDLVYVVLSAERPRWALAALDTGEVLLRLPSDGSAERRFVEPVTDGDLAERVRAAFRVKYGHTRWTRYFTADARVLRLRRDRMLATRSREERIREEFDVSAPAYSARVEQNPFERLLRERSRAFLTERFRGCDPLVELGCGTGLETLALLAAGHEITALDISPQMLAQLTQRAGHEGTLPRLTTIEGTIGRLGQSLAHREDGYFRGGYSTFGALNLEPDLDNLPVDLARLLTPGSTFVAGVLNLLGVVPKLYEAAVQGPAGFVARMRVRIPPGAIRYPLEVEQFHPFRWGRAFAPYFRLDSVLAVSVLAPPFDSPRLQTYWGSQGLRKLSRLDRWLTSTPIGWALAEWVFVTLVRTSRPSANPS